MNEKKPKKKPFQNQHQTGEETSHPESPIRKRVPTGTPNISEVGQIKQTINNGLREFSQQNSSSSSFDSEMVTRLSAFLDTCIDRSFDLSSADAASQVLFFILFFIFYFYFLCLPLPLPH